LLKSPEGFFKRDVIDGYGLSRVETDVLWDYVNNFIKEHYLACRFDNQVVFYAVSAAEPAGKPIKEFVGLFRAKLGIPALRELPGSQAFGRSSSPGRSAFSG